jgi:hypothetical protein
MPNNIAFRSVAIRTKGPRSSTSTHGSHGMCDAFDEPQFENRIILAHARTQLLTSLTPAASPRASRPVIE